MTPSNTSTSRKARAPRAPKLVALQADGAVIAPVRQPSRLDQMQALLLAPAGASIAELIAATGWQQHSVRGAIAGALRKRGLIIASDKVAGVRRYRASMPA